jgi:hypothetical protein
LELNQPYSLCAPIAINVTVIVEIIEGTAWFHGSSSGLEIQGCTNRCWSRVRVNSLPAYEVYNIEVVRTPNVPQTNSGGTASQSGLKPIAADLELGPGDVVQYSGPLSVILTGTSADHARIKVSFSDEEL